MTIPAWKRERHNYSMKYKTTKESRPIQSEGTCDCGWGNEDKNATQQAKHTGKCMYCGRHVGQEHKDMKHAYSYPDGSFYKYVATELSKEELSATLMRSIDELDLKFVSRWIKI